MPVRGDSFLGTEASSSVVSYPQDEIWAALDQRPLENPNPEALQQAPSPQEVAHPAPNQEDVAELITKRKEAEEKLYQLLRMNSRIEPKFTFVMRAKDDLHIDTSDLERLTKLCEALEAYMGLDLSNSNGNEILKNIKATMRDWERNGRP